MRPFSEAGKVKSSTSLSQKCKSIANFDVVDRCSKMRPFSEAGKVKSSTSLSQKCKIIANCAIIALRIEVSRAELGRLYLAS